MHLTRSICRVVGTILVVAGASLLLMDWQADCAYRRLGETHGPGSTTAIEPETSETPDQRQPNWQELTAINPAISGWIRVEGTDIDLPVMSSASVPDGYYLTHDLWEHPSRTGVPFLDRRCEPKGTHCIVYGHHLATGGQFSALQKMYEQKRFETLGSCLWFTIDGEVHAYEPLFALVVDQWFDPIQRFDFQSDADLRAWIGAIAVQAQAASDDSSDRIAQTTHVMTLVTCTSDLAGQPWRTLVVFVAPNG